MAPQHRSIPAVLDRQMETRDDPDQLQSSRDLILNLQSQLKLLTNRVKELELENARLSKVSSCCCGKVHGTGESLQAIEDKMVGMNVEKVDGNSKNNRKKKSRETASGYYLRTVHHHAKRYIALKIMYFGKRFYGFASEAQMDPTVESEIFKALEKAKLLVVDQKLQYSRCGRTDKGVSAIGQVISLYLRSKLKSNGERLNCEEVNLEGISEKEEIDYVRVLNRNLPNDIRVLGWYPVPTDFHARFSCLSREYKYFFWRDGLDIAAMETAGMKFIGEHDFRNFCKMDALNVHNYRRQIALFEIVSFCEWFSGDEIWAVRIKGSAFLWHQVRCMVAVLFMIGQGLESPTVVDLLLDIYKTPRKPQYTMAPELPLVLQSCEFEGLNFICSSDAGQALREHLKKEFRSLLMQAVIFHETLNHFPMPGSCSLQEVKKKTVHVPLMSRPTEPSYEERRSKYDKKVTCKSPPICQKKLQGIMDESKSAVDEQSSA